MQRPKPLLHQQSLSPASRTHSNHHPKGLQTSSIYPHPSTMYVNTPPPIASTIYSIFFFSATSKIPHIIQIDSKFTFMSTVPQANSISLCTISCLMSFGKQSSPPDVKSWTTFFTNKFEKSQKNKPYKVFSRFRTDLSLVGLNCFLYMILS